MASTSTHSTDATEFETFLAMAREFPIRTGFSAVGLPAIALLQLLAGIFSDSSVAIIAIFAGLMIAAAIALTRYQIAIYRREKISDRWLEAE